MLGPGLCLPVVVGRNGVGDPSGIGVGVDDANRGDVVEGAFVEQHIVFQRVQADDEIRTQGRAVVELLLEAGDFLVKLVDNLGLAAAENLLAVGDAAGDPALEQVVGLGQLGGTRNGSVLALARAYKQDDAAAERRRWAAVTSSAMMWMPWRMPWM